VATTNMSIAARSGRWLRRKLRQVGEGTLGRHGIHLPTVAWLILMPSLSNSPWMRGAPHNGLALLIRRIKARISVPIFGRPGRRDRRAPMVPKALAMPLDHGRRLDQYHRVDDLRPNPVEPHPQEPVERGKLRPTGPLSAQDGQLML